MNKTPPSPTGNLSGGLLFPFPPFSPLQGGKSSIKKLRDLLKRSTPCLHEKPQRHARVRGVGACAMAVCVVTSRPTVRPRARAGRCGAATPGRRSRRSRSGRWPVLFFPPNSLHRTIGRSTGWAGREAVEGIGREDWGSSPRMEDWSEVLVRASRTVLWQRAEGRRQGVADRAETQT